MLPQPRTSPLTFASTPGTVIRAGLVCVYLCVKGDFFGFCHSLETALSSRQRGRLYFVLELQWDLLIYYWLWVTDRALTGEVALNVCCSHFCEQAFFRKKNKALQAKKIYFFLNVSNNYLNKTSNKVWNPFSCHDILKCGQVTVLGCIWTSKCIELCSFSGFRVLGLYGYQVKQFLPHYPPKILSFILHKVDNFSRNQVFYFTILTLFAYFLLQ